MKMSRKIFTQFKGLVSPVFTPFNKKFQVNFEAIPKYAKFLKSKSVKAVLVNGTSGEGMSLNREERMRITEKWIESCNQLDILMMVQISGCSFMDALELAKHAENVGVHGVLCLPELYFRPKNVQQLISYLKEISMNCSKVPLYYYHIPIYTKVDFPMSNLMKSARNEIENFAGIKYSSNEIDKAVDCLNLGQIFMGTNSTLMGCLALGFDSAIMTTLNNWPDISHKIVELMNDEKVKEAQAEQFKLNELIRKTLSDGNGDWISSLKRAFNRDFGDFVDLGPIRKPLAF